MPDVSYTQVIYLMILLVAVIGWTLVEYRGRPGTALRALFAWGLIFVGAMAAYGIWTDLRLDGRGKMMLLDNGSVEVERSLDGHYYLRLMIGNVPVDFMVDTGATNIILSMSDAARLGIDPASLSFADEAQTANGTVLTAPVQLNNVLLGPWYDSSLPAWVSGGATESSLLGMDYLSLFHLQFAGDRMLLRR
jgi:aspartyl protease family protein